MWFTTGSDIRRSIQAVVFGLSAAGTSLFISTGPKSQIDVHPIHSQRRYGVVVKHEVLPENDMAFLFAWKNFFRYLTQRKGYLYTTLYRPTDESAATAAKQHTWMRRRREVVIDIVRHARGRRQREEGEVREGEEGAGEEEETTCPLTDPPKEVDCDAAEGKGCAEGHRVSPSVLPTTHSGGPSPPQPTPPATPPQPRVRTYYHIMTWLELSYYRKALDEFIGAKLLSALPTEGGGAQLMKIVADDSDETFRSHSAKTVREHYEKSTGLPVEGLDGGARGGM